MIMRIVEATQNGTRVVGIQDMDVDGGFHSLRLTRKCPWVVVTVGTQGNLIREVVAQCLISVD